MRVREVQGLGDTVAAPRPRVVQLAFGCLLILDVLLRVGVGSLEIVSWPGLAAALVLLPVLVVVLLDPPQQAPGLLVAAVAVSDLALVGLTSTEGGSSGTAAFAVLPAMWLAARYGGLGSAWASGATVVLVGLAPRLLDPSAGGPLVALAPVLLLVVFSAVSVGIFTSSARTEVVRHQGDSATLAAVLDTVDVGIAVLDLDGELLAQNRRHEDNIHRAHPEGFPGVSQTTQHGFAEDGHTPLAHHERPTVLSQQGHELDDYRIWVGADPDTRVALSVSTRTVRDVAGRPTGSVIATRDITVFMRAMLTREEFISRASHDLRTPLSAIFGYLHLLGAHDDLSDAAREDLESVVQSAERMARQVADLVHAARQEQATVALSRRETRIVPLVTEVVDTHRPASRTAGVCLELHVDGEGTALLDPERMGELLGLLVDDAVERSQEGGIVHVAVEVADGVGEISVVGDGSRTVDQGDHDDRGDPLDRCREIAEAHGGRLETEDGASGVVVRVRLRLEPGQQSAT